MNTSLRYSYSSWLGILLLILISSSCKKFNLESPDLDITIPKTTFAINEPITFTFNGNADVITFFSGEMGKEYKNKNILTLDGKPQMQFTSYLQTGVQDNTLSVLISRDFRGEFTIPLLQIATWTDITSRATLSTGLDNTQSGVIDLSDFLVNGAPVYIAFRYTATSASAQPTWTIKNIAIDNVASDGTATSIATSANINWGAISVLNSAKSWTSSTTQLQFTTSPIGTDDNEDWIISQPLTLNRAQNSFGKSLKASPTTKLTTYKFPGYTVPGTYTVSFESTNSNKNDVETILKEFTITVQ